MYHILLNLFAETAIFDFARPCVVIRSQLDGVNCQVSQHSCDLRNFLTRLGSLERWRSTTFELYLRPKHSKEYESDCKMMSNLDNSATGVHLDTNIHAPLPPQPIPLTLPSDPSTIKHRLDPIIYPLTPILLAIGTPIKCSILERRIPMQLR